MNKFKILSIAIYCFVSALWTETHGMEQSSRQERYNRYFLSKQYNMVQNKANNSNIIHRNSIKNSSTEKNEKISRKAVTYEHIYGKKIAAEYLKERLKHRFNDQ